MIYAHTNIIILISVARTQYNIIMYRHSCRTNRILIYYQSDNNIHVNVITIFKRRFFFSTVLRSHNLSCTRIHIVFETDYREHNDSRTLLIQRSTILMPWDLIFSHFIFDSNASCPYANTVRSPYCFQCLAFKDT